MQTKRVKAAKPKEGRLDKRKEDAARKAALRVGALTFAHVSGPVSYAILESAASHSPSFILFGDRHDSFSGMCGKEVPEIWNSAFWSALADLAEEKKLKIHVYLEVMMSLAETKVPDFSERAPWDIASIGPLSRVFNKFIGCFDHAHPTVYKDCPTKGLQWHFGDVRQLPEWTDERRWWEPLINALVLAMNDASEFFLVVRDLRAFNPPDWTTDDLLEQIQKSQLRHEWETNWVEAYVETSLAQVSPSVNVNQLEKDVSNFISAVQNALEADERAPKLPVSHFETQGHLIRLLSPLMDLYTLTRLTKPSHMPHIAVVYAGDYHIQQMTRFLENNGWATVVERQQERRITREEWNALANIPWGFDGADRCLSFQSEIDVEALAMAALRNQLAFDPSQPAPPAHPARQRRLAHLSSKRSVGNA